MPIANWEIEIRSKSMPSKFIDQYNINDLAGQLELIAQTIRANVGNDYVYRLPMDHIPHLSGESEIMIDSEYIRVIVTKNIGDYMQHKPKYHLRFVHAGKITEGAKDFSILQDLKVWLAIALGNNYTMTSYSAKKITVKSLNRPVHYGKAQMNGNRVVSVWIVPINAQ